MSKTQEIKNAPKQVKARVISSARVTEGVHLLWLEARYIAATARPGQLAMLKCESGAFIRRPLSIHRVSDDKMQVAFSSP